MMTMIRPLTAVLSLGAALAAMALVAPNRAEACGGCFAPNDSVTVVTAHRMAVSVSSTQTTLWDQIEYAGDPEDFVWVLPIQGEMLVELADNAFFEALEQATTVNLQGSFAPYQNFCPDPCGGLRGGAADSGVSADGGVTVYGEAVVGPYETVTIGSEDPNALVTWLQGNDYAVPDSILPTIAHYVDQGLNFAVLRLSPTSGVSQMQPVRITTSGLMPVFPLRMVAAGVTDKVGLDLFIIGEGRYGAANFNVVEIDQNELVYDWNTGSFNYLEIFDETLTAAGGRAWVAEYAQPQSSWQNAQYYESYSDGSERHSAMADYDIAIQGLSAPYLTRLRTDLLAEYLNEDLILSASTEGDISNFISVSQEVNRPPPISCSDECTYLVDAGGPTAVGRLRSPGAPESRTTDSRSGLCAVSSPGATAASGGGSESGPLFLGAVFALAGVVSISRRQRRS